MVSDLLPSSGLGQSPQNPNSYARWQCLGPSIPAQAPPGSKHKALLTVVSSDTAQRSAQELPLVEKQSTDSYPVIGGKKMVLSGHNFLQDSKVIFVEKAPGMFFRTVWVRSCTQCWWELAPGWQDMDPPPA